MQSAPATMGRELVEAVDVQRRARQARPPLKCWKRNVFYFARTRRRSHSRYGADRVRRRTRDSRPTSRRRARAVLASSKLRRSSQPNTRGSLWRSEKRESATDDKLVTPVEATQPSSHADLSNSSQKPMADFARLPCVRPNQTLIFGR